MSDKPTCGVMYKKLLEYFAGDADIAVRLFAAGFVSGQAEKIYSGVCQAAMFRPSSERHIMLTGVVHVIAAVYELVVLCEGEEIWICRQDAFSRVSKMLAMKPNDPETHEVRAMLCGIPASEIDHEFHLRRGFGEKCD